MSHTKKSAEKTKKASESTKRPTLKMVEMADVLKWKAPDYYTFEKSPFWALGVGLVAIALSLVLIYTENYFPVIIIILAVIVTFQIAHEKPKTQEFALDEGGALSRNTFIPYSEIKSFWITKHGVKSILYLEPVNPIKGAIVIPVGGANPLEIRNFLLRYLPEKLEAGEALSEKLIRIFRI